MWCKGRSSLYPKLPPTNLCPSGPLSAAPKSFQVRLLNFKTKRNFQVAFDHKGKQRGKRSLGQPEHATNVSIPRGEGGKTLGPTPTQGLAGTGGGTTGECEQAAPQPSRLLSNTFPRPRTCSCSSGPGISPGSCHTAGSKGSRFHTRHQTSRPRRSRCCGSPGGLHCAHSQGGSSSYAD